MDLAAFTALTNASPRRSSRRVFVLGLVGAALTIAIGADDLEARPKHKKKRSKKRKPVRAPQRGKHKKKKKRGKKRKPNLVSPPPTPPP
jgi:hypothetical protein